MSMVASLREAIQARKFQSMEMATQIDRRVRELRNLLSGSPLTKIQDLQLSLIARISAEAAGLQTQYLELQREIETAEKELA